MDDPGHLKGELLSHSDSHCSGSGRAEVQWHRAEAGCQPGGRVPLAAAPAGSIFQTPGPRLDSNILR
jgi:hypothetical protein